MSISLFIFTYINVWCVMLFFTVAFGVRKDDEGAVGYVAAPKAVRWKRKLLINSVASLVVTVVIAGIIYSGVIRVRG